MTFTPERWDASSGAAVTVLAKWIFDNGGAVAGAIFDNEMILYEDIANSLDEYIEKGFSKSKYVQSETRDCFLKIKKWLNENKAPFLFVGTPCLNAALTTFLGKDYPNLVKIDFVCHGVPSPGVFKSYCKYLEKKYSSSIKKVTFRVKKPSWRLSSTLYEFSNGKKYLGNMMEDPYNSCFANNNNNLRDCCYNCRYACRERSSDITVCDYWGKREVVLTNDDETHGVSIVMLNTLKGRRMFESVREHLIYSPVSYKSVIAVNTRLIDPKLKHPDSEAFWQEYLTGKSWDELKKYCQSYLDTVSFKEAFLLKYDNNKLIVLVRKILKFLKKRG